jgi:hypothetical protein
VVKSEGLQLKHGILTSALKRFFHHEEHEEKPSSWIFSPEPLSDVLADSPKQAARFRPEDSVNETPTEAVETTAIPKNSLMIVFSKLRAPSCSSW